MKIALTIFVLIISFTNVPTLHNFKDTPCIRLQPAFIGKLVILPLAGHFYVMKKEKWVHLTGYEGLYMVSSNGRVKTMQRNVYDKNGGLHYIQKEKIMKGSTYDHYPIVRIRKDSISINIFIHRLVALCFIPNPENKPFVNHKNGVKTDNRVSNLEWCTKSENTKHSYEYLGQISYFKGLYGKHNPRSIPVIQSDKDGNFIRRWDSASVAERDGGFSHACISCCLVGKTQTHKGFRWKYA